MSLEKREDRYDAVLELLSKGYDKPHLIARQLGIERHTASRWLKIVKARLVADEAKRNNTQRRAEAIHQAMQTLRMAHQSHAEARNCGNTNAAIGAIRTAIEAQKRIAALTGLDTTNLSIGPTQEDFDAAADALLAASPPINVRPDGD